MKFDPNRNKRNEKEKVYEIECEYQRFQIDGTMNRKITQVKFLNGD